MLSAGTRCFAALRTGAHHREHDIPLFHISVARSYAPLLLLKTRPSGHESRALLAGREQDRQRYRPVQRSPRGWERWFWKDIIPPEPRLLRPANRGDPEDSPSGVRQLLRFRRPVRDDRRESVGPSRSVHFQKYRSVLHRRRGRGVPHQGVMLVSFHHPQLPSSAGRVFRAGNHRRCGDTLVRHHSNVSEEGW